MYTKFEWNQMKKNNTFWILFSQYENDLNLFKYHIVDRLYLFINIDRNGKLKFGSESKTVSKIKTCSTKETRCPFSCSYTGSLYLKISDGKAFGEHVFFKRTKKSKKEVVQVFIFREVSLFCSWYSFNFFQWKLKYKFSAK